MSSPTFLSMATILLYTLLFLHAKIATCNELSAMNLNLSESSEVDATSRNACDGVIGECLTEPEMMESDISRRVLLTQKRYISYETLRRDMVPCGKAGASYYNCHASQANPYSRGCEIITRCARKT